MAVSAKRNARIEITSSAAGVDKGVNDARRKMRAFQREQDKIAKQQARDEAKRAKDAEKARDKHVKASLGFGQAAVGGLAAAAGFDVAGGIGGVTHEIMDAQKELTRFQIDAQLSAAEVAAFNDQLTTTSNETGQSRLELIKAAHAYQILTGDAQGAVSATKLFADVANASGATMEDIAATAASLKQNLGFDPADFRKGFDVLLTLGHKGSVELRDVAAEMSGLAPQFKDFGQGSSLDKLTEMGAAMQVIRKNFADASEMATGFRSLMTAVTKKQKELGEHGVQVFKTDPKTHKLIKRDFLAIIGDILKNPALNDKVLPKLLGRQEAVRALGAMRDHWAEIAQLQHEAANSDQVSKDAHTYMESSSGRIAKVWEQTKNTIADALSPERVQAFASMLETAGQVWKDIFSIGKKVRGAISGTEPVKLSEADQAVLAAADYEAKGGKAKFMRGAAESARGEEVGAFNDDKKWATVVEFARKRAADIQPANAAAAEIMNAENDERTTPESIQRAILAHANPGGHTALIGEKYLKAAGITPEREQELIGKNFKEALTPLLAELKDINDSLQRPPPVKVGAEPIQRAVSNNILKHTRPGGR